ncbi:DUF4407 domain-containing protein [Herbidospora galbida]|uniref:DUF4407 domain-containing protein n=1 Tax=Herbidospora galbida TaxID=2575442 RepID=A0A4U3MJ42_9ACTN|nr:DUF4407 domain-containing protein [Herbidospora galbida]TKK89518.1 DUF4407 domain-containing protein [Herbidospora galbida]
MTTDTRATVQPEALDLLSVPIRPAPPVTGWSRKVRRFAGVLDEVLDWVPEERSRYTWQAIVLLNAGMLATLSMWIFLGRAFSVSWWLLLPPAVLWGWLVISFDAWLISSTHGMKRGRHFTLLSRLILAALVGFVIAEPLVLRLFEPTIHKQVQETRQREVVAYASLLNRCNPPDGGTVTDPACADQRVEVRRTAPDIEKELADTREERRILAKTVRESDSRHNRLVDNTNGECDGTSGTGQPGNKEVCKLKGRAAADFQASRQGDLDLLKELKGKVKDLIEKRRIAENADKALLSIRLDELVKERRENQGGIGVLEELHALHALAKSDSVVNAAQWLIRALLITLECWPVMTKLLGGRSTYDRLIADRLTLAYALHERETELHTHIKTGHLRVVEATEQEHIDSSLNEVAKRKRARLEEMDNTQRAEDAQQQENLIKSIDELAARYRGQSV